MTRSEIELVRAAFDHISPRLERVCHAFCEKLFDLDLSLRTLFPNDLHPLIAHLATGLEAVVRSLDDLGSVLVRAPALGLRLASYGLEPADLATIGTAFFATLESEMGEALTQDALAAWRRVFWTIALVTAGAMGEALPAAA